MEKISVVGLGYVGLPLALVAANAGYKVTGIDLDSEKIQLINEGIDPLHDEFVKQHIKGTSLLATSDASNIRDSEVVVVCVPTPVIDDYQPDLGPLKGAVSSVAQNLEGITTIIIESTVNPGVCEDVVIPLIEEVSGKKVNVDFYVSHCPERINPGDKIWNVENIPRVVGSSSEAGLRLTVDFYNKILKAPIRAMASLKEAEACKVVENSFRDINIAFVNELAMSFSKLGINVKNVIDGAATKPFAFMPHYPSIGVGGHCIPVDPYYLIEYARSSGFEHEFLSLARSINNQMPEFAVNQLRSSLAQTNSSLEGKKVALLGLSYKPNVADDRESPSYVVKKLLEAQGAKVVAFDPYLLDKSDVETLDEAIEDAIAIVVCVNHKEFMGYDFSHSNAKVFVDGKNAFNNAKFPETMIYCGIGINN